MEINQAICGFKVKRIKDVKDICAVLYEMEHEKTGAKLCYLDRRDNNMSFAISFATPPEDDTGVFHIIEHSVLCGSEKYPLRDPFAELLKGSLNTFLNAMTYEDRTVYPVSSRCEKDFLNLVGVYLDATLHPNVITNPNIFRQEGWHYEYDGESLTRSGVVYNEMKGAYSSADDLALAEINRSLYAGGTYSKDSGGDPDAIPTLTHEELARLHQKYYHPSNSQIFLDGAMDLEKVLGLIDRELSVFDKREICADCLAAAPTSSRKSIRYEISEGGESDKARLLLGYSFADYSDQQKLAGSALLCEYLCGSNASPLKRTVLESGLCKDVNMFVNRAGVQTVVIEARDAERSDLEKIEQLILSRIREIAENGIDKEALSSELDLVEFKMRERDFGSFPAGIAMALSVFGAWRYGALPEEALEFEDKISALREKINGDYFEKLLLEMTVNNPHSAVIHMIPDEKLAEERAKAEEEDLKKILDGMSAEELETIKQEAEQMRAWQKSEEDDEALSTIPTLEISDIPEKTEFPKVSEKMICGCKSLHIPAQTNGISYLHLLFDVSDTKAEDLWKLPVLCGLLLSLDTEEEDALSLQNKVKSSLGKFNISTISVEKDGVTIPYFHISASVLDSKKDKLISIIREVLLTSDFDNEKEVENTLAQMTSFYEDSAVSSGHAVALARAEAYFNERGATSEYLSGYEAYLKLKEAEKNGQSGILAKELCALNKKIVNKNRLTVALSGCEDDEFIESVINLFPEGEGAVKTYISPLGARREFFLVPSKVAYAVFGSPFHVTAEISGALRTVRSILSYEYLWTTVRMEGGAYGAGFICRRNGMNAFYSYRDPSPMRSLGCFDGSSEYLRTLSQAGTDLTKFIIGAFGEYDILQTPQSAASTALTRYLNGIDENEENKLRSGIINTNPKILSKIADMLDESRKNGGICIVGGAEHLESCKENIDNVLKL